MITPRSQLNESGTVIAIDSNQLLHSDQNGDNNVRLLIEHSYSCLSSQEHDNNQPNQSNVANGNVDRVQLAQPHRFVEATQVLHPQEPSVQPISSSSLNSTEPTSTNQVQDKQSSSEPIKTKTNGNGEQLKIDSNEGEANLRTRSRRERKVPAKLLDKDFIDTSDMSVITGKKTVEESTPTATSKTVNARENRRSSKGSTPAEPSKTNDEDDEDDDEEEDDDNDDDPYKEYCICRKPHGNRFMIACDKCEDWFHGSCIGVSKKQSEMYEVWICTTCKQTDPTLECRLKPSATATGPSEHSSGEGRKRLSSESESTIDASGNKIKDRVKRTGPNTKGSDVRIKKLSKIEGSNGLSNKVREKGADIDEEEEKEKLRLKELIEKRKKELVEKEKRREKKLGPLDPTINQLFQVSSASPTKKKSECDSDGKLEPVMRCLVCVKGKLKKATTVYCSLECMKQHVKFARKSRRRLSTISNINESTQSIEIISSISSNTESSSNSVTTPTTASPPSDVKAPSDIAKSTATLPLPTSPTATSSATTTTATIESTTSSQLTPPSDHSTAGEISPSGDADINLTGNKDDSTKKTEERAYEHPEQLILTYPVYDAFDPRDDASEGSKRKMDDVPEKELLHFLIRHPNFTYSPELKVKYRLRKPSSSESSETPSKDSRRTSFDSTTSKSNQAAPTSANKINSNSRAKRKSESDSHQPSKSSKSSHEHSSSSGHKHKSNEKVNAGSNRTEDIKQRQVREKVEKAFVDALNSRIASSSHLTDVEKEKRKSKVENLCKNIESELFKLFATSGKLNDSSLKNYLSKYRSLVFNLKDAKNQLLFDSLFNSPEEKANLATDATYKIKISPAEMVRMSSEELARGSDLDAWRKVEAKKSLINSVIINEEELKASQAMDPSKEKSQEDLDTPSEMDLIASLPVTEELNESTKGDGKSLSRSNSVTNGTSQAPTVKIRMSKTAADFNPLDKILNEITSTTKTREKQPVEQVPKSPPHEKRKKTEEPEHKEKERKRESDRKKKKIKEEKDEKPKSKSKDPQSPMVAVKRVTIQPELPQLLGVDLLNSNIDQEDVKRLVMPAVSSAKKVVWEGFCSGFEDSASSTKDATTAASRFPLVWFRYQSSIIESPSEGAAFTPEFSSLNVIGRIAPEQVASYVQKLVISNSNDSDSIIDLIPLHLRMKRKKLTFDSDEYEDDLDYLVDDEPDDEADEESLSYKENYDKFINYLVTRKRYAVVDVRMGKKMNMKDMYLLPFDLATVHNQSELKRQLTSDVLLDIFSRTPSCTEIRESRAVKKMILLVLLIKKSRDKRRERSGSTSSSSSSLASGQLKYIPSVKSSLLSEQEGSKLTTLQEERSYTPPPLYPPQTSVLPSSHLDYHPTPIQQISLEPNKPSLGQFSTHSASGDPAYGTTDGFHSETMDKSLATSYIPGLSPDREETSTLSEPMDDEEELKKKAVLQMQLLNHNPM